jgi:hypothetical protein
LFFGIDPDLRPKQDAALERILARLARRDQNYGLDRIEILEGNVGYMRIRSVMFPEEVKGVLDASMRFLSNADAMIFDLRGNRGGDPQYMAYLFSYFLEKPTLINRIYWRDRDRTDEYWTQGSVPGDKMPDVPLFVLISRQTFSGAEEFAYDLQALKRATIVGEVSAGGANPASSWVVFKDLRISIPIGRAINPVTGTNWEGASQTGCRGPRGFGSNGRPRVGGKGRTKTQRRKKGEAPGEVSPMPCRHRRSQGAYRVRKGSSRGNVGDVHLELCG